MKTGNSLTTRSHYIQEGAAAPGVGVAVFFRPRAQPVPGGPRPPSCIALVQESTSPPVFLKRKPADHPGCLGGHPLSVSLRPFSTRRKDVAAHWISLFIRTTFYMRGQTPTRPAKTGLAYGPPPFFTQRKGEKKRQGEPPWNPPGILIFRAIVGHHNGG